MFGFIIGTVCLIGLVVVLRRGRRGRGFGFGPRHFYNRVFRKLETSVSQEKEIVAAVDELRKSMDGLRQEFRVSRTELATMFERDEVTEGEFDALFGRHQESIDALRRTAVGSFQRVHSTLDTAQRKTFARMVADGMRRGRFGGPYRHASH